MVCQKLSLVKEHLSGLDSEVGLTQSAKDLEDTPLLSQLRDHLHETSLWRSREKAYVSAEMPESVLNSVVDFERSSIGYLAPDVISASAHLVKLVRQHCPTAFLGMESSSPPGGLPIALEPGSAFAH